jgi:Terminase large subunit, T4likevirus-type, N-terminal
MNNLREIAYQIDPALWVHEVIGVGCVPPLKPTGWQEQFLRAPRGASILALTARQVGKTTTAAWAIAHAMLFTPGSLSVIACPAQRQSAEAVRRVREVLVKAGVKFKSDNVYGLELENGSRVLALPGSDDSIRGLTVDAWIVADEAARLPDDLIAALRPMRARRPDARFAMLSTAWSRSDPFWKAWAGDDPSWIRLKATADTDTTLFTAEFLEQERRALGDHDFKREYLGIPGGGQASPFTWDLYERATRFHVPKVPPGPAFAPPPERPAVPLKNPFKDLQTIGGLR